MKAEIKNFMGCASAEIVADRIALILGHNGQGKSSSLLPISAALNGGVPLDVPKSKAGMLVQTGAATSSAVLSNESSSVSVEYPKCERRGVGPAQPEASAIAVGVEQFPTMPTPNRVEVLRALLHCEPSKDELFAALGDKFDDKLKEVVWHSIEVDGWDAALARASEKGRSLKAQWQLATGEKYGEKKAESWFPTGWETDLECASKESLDDQLTVARSTLEYRVGNQAVADDELERLTALIETIPELTEVSRRCQSEISAAEDALKDARSALAKLPELPKYDMVCPHCGKPVVYQGGRLVAVEQKLSDEERDALEQKRLDASNAVSKAERELSAKRSSYDASVSQLKTAERAEADYAEKSKRTGSADEVEAAREDVRRCEVRVGAFAKYSEAKRLHRAICDNQAIIDVLNPDGIRRSALQRGLNTFNEQLASACSGAQWAAVSVDSSMSVEFNGRPFVICSESEKFRACVTIQIVLAALDKSTAIVIDGADVLDKSGRRGLLRLLASTDISAFVGMMVSAPDAVPDLRKMGIGRKYWIENGKCEEVFNG